MPTAFVDTWTADDLDELPRICFVAHPDGYGIELIDGDFPTPQDGDR